MSRNKKNHTYHRQPKANRKKSWLYLNLGLALALIVAGVVALFWLGQQSKQSTASASNPAADHQGRVAPDFTLYSPQGQSISLSDYAGQVILVNTWATWCPPCKAEMPTLNAFYEEHQQEGFVVLAVNSREDTDTVKRFIEQNGFSFPVLLDTRAEVMKRYNVLGLPTTFVIDREGFIQYVHTGEISRQQLEEVILPLL
jgi:peroxiredoxin